MRAAGGGGVCGGKGCGDLGTVGARGLVRSGADGEGFGVVVGRGADLNPILILVCLLWHLSLWDLNLVNNIIRGREILRDVRFTANDADQLASGFSTARIIICFEDHDL